MWLPGSTRLATHYLNLGHTLASARAEWGGLDHGGEVTVAHRHRDAEAARTNSEVSIAVDRMATTLRAALHIEQSLALRALLSAASISTTNEEEDNARLPKSDCC